MDRLLFIWTRIPTRFAFLVSLGFVLRIPRTSFSSVIFIIIPRLSDAGTVFAVFRDRAVNATQGFSTLNIVLGSFQARS